MQSLYWGIFWSIDALAVLAEKKDEKTVANSWNRYNMAVT
jgi:hypothetical protein